MYGDQSFGYEAGIFLRKKLKIGIFNPLLVSIVFVIIVLKVTGIDYDTYDKGANVLSYLLTPSTVCLGQFALSADESS